VLTAVVTGSGDSLEVSFLDANFVGQAFVAAEQEVPENDLNPIAPEAKEFLWGMGSFAVMAIVLRYVLYPKLKKGMEARAEAIRADRDAAEAVTASARADVAEYEAQVAEQEQFSQRTSGFRYTTFTALLFAGSLIAFAFLPSRY